VRIEIEEEKNLSNGGFECLEVDSRGSRGGSYSPFLVDDFGAFCVVKFIGGSEGRLGEGRSHG
jgi:hypothetical protein